MKDINQITKKIIRLINEENESDKAFSDREVLFFRFLTKYRQSKQPTGNELYTIIKKNLPVFGFSPDTLTHYVNLFTQNYRPDGRYDLTKSSELKDYTKTKQKRIYNTDARDYVENLKPFRGSNLEGRWEQDYRGDWGYVVTSYGWYPIFIHKYKKWFETNNRYSSSTGKQMSRSRPYVSGIISLDRREMDKIRNGVDIDKFLTSKTSEFVEKVDKLIDSGSIDRVRMGWYPRIRVAFKYTGVRVENGKPELDVDVISVDKFIDNKLDREAGDFFNDEMEGVTKEYLEDLLRGYISNTWYESFGETDQVFNKNLTLNVNYTK